MEILELKPAPRGKGRFLVKLEDGSVLQVGVNEIADWSLYEGRDLTEEETARLKGDLRVRNFRDKAAAILSRRRQSRRQIEEKLDQWGANEEEIPEICGRLEAEGLLDDRAYAADIVEYYGAKGYGMRRLRDELYHRKVPRELWEEALEQRESSDDVILELVRKKMGGKPPRREDLKKASDFLARRGYSWDEIRRGIWRYEEEYEYGSEDGEQERAPAARRGQEQG